MRSQKKGEMVPVRKQGFCMCLFPMLVLEIIGKQEFMLVLGKDQV